MTIKLVTLKQTKEHLRVTHVADDDDTLGKIEQASAIVLDYLKLDAIPDGWDAGTGDSPGRKTVPFVVQAAVLLIVGELFKNREASAADLLSKTVTDLLVRWRDPAFA